MAEDADFDIDSLLASFRPDDPKQEPDDLDREIAGFVPTHAEALNLDDALGFKPSDLRLSEEHIASAAQANGTAAGDGEALGEAQTPMSALAQAIEGLTVAVRDLRITAEKLRAAQVSQAAYGHPEHPVTTDSEEEPVTTEDLETILFGSAAEPESEPPAPVAPPSKRRRKPAS